MTTLSPEQLLEKAFREGRVRMEPPCPECQCHVLPVGIDTETGLDSFGYHDRIVPIHRTVRLSCGHSMRAEYTLHVTGSEDSSWLTTLSHLE